MANYPLRISNELMQDIKIISEYEGRSVNKEIEYILNIYIDELKKNSNNIKLLFTGTK